MSVYPVTALTIASRFVGLKETVGKVHTPAIVAMLDICDPFVHDDETPWCSAFANYVAWLLGVQRSGSLAARSWLTVGTAVSLTDAKPGYDVVILSRGPNSPPATVLAAPGHVGFFAGRDLLTNTVRVLGGNQGNQVCYENFPVARILGIRRLA